MCVIVYKGLNKKKLPSEAIVEACWLHNPHGAGVMWRWENSKETSFVKGFTDLPQLQDWLDRSRKVLEDNRCEVAIHFRITTHGGTSAGNTHPFIVARNADPHLLEGKAKYVLMHNGVMPLIPRKDDYSDSAELALRAAETRDPIGFLDKIDEFLKQNRVLVFTPQGAKFYGDKFKKGEGGFLYSNLNHEYVPKYDYGYTGQLRGYNWSQWEKRDKKPLTLKDIECEMCGKAVSRITYIKTGYGTLGMCDDCREDFEEHAESCSACGKRFYPEDMSWDNEKPYCVECQDELERMNSELAKAGEVK